MNYKLLEIPVYRLSPSELEKRYIETRKNKSIIREGETERDRLKRKNHWDSYFSPQWEYIEIIGYIILNYNSMDNCIQYDSNFKKAKRYYSKCKKAFGKIDYFNGVYTNLHLNITNQEILSSIIDCIEEVHRRVLNKDRYIDLPYYKKLISSINWIHYIDKTNSI